MSQTDAPTHGESPQLEAGGNGKALPTKIERVALYFTGKGVSVGLKHRGSPHYDIPPTNASHYMTVLPPLLCVQK